METTIKWQIEWMHVIPQDGEYTDIVLSAGWRCIGTDGEHYGTLYGSCNFTKPSGDFTPYDQLTESQVLDWCWASQVDKQSIETAIRTEIDGQKVPSPAIKPLPWN